MNSQTAITEKKSKVAILPIYSVTPFTMLDFPERTACIIWFSGCNMRCGYCHNPQIVKGKGRGTVKEVMAFLHKRRGLLDGVVLSGGEASVYTGLPDFIREVKQLGYAVKIDTNGMRPDIIADFLDQGFLDYIALDYKAPPDKFKKVTGVEKYAFFNETLDILCAQNDVPFEVRTTVHTDLMNEEDVGCIIRDLNQRGYAGVYYVQNFCADNERPTLGMLPAQKRILNISTLPQAKEFTIEFRNF
ncbi:MAG: anaerobic ribonucleoside-triphosphate reductase activating protein [Alphaproteobacteria bacterium CG_4_9_14_3_um_filter_47_13]|nr:MAG: anaerobic ribonucleoside-triphosphate reductase activating protein [Alphaproteobacteria bacterium CG_4_9_14_3_um_filter_47_13]